jgi:hypothetical protein
MTSKEMEPIPPWDLGTLHNPKVCHYSQKFDWIKQGSLSKIPHLTTRPLHMINERNYLHCHMTAYTSQPGVPTGLHILAHAVLPSINKAYKHSKNIHCNNLTA